MLKSVLMKKVGAEAAKKKVLLPIPDEDEPSQDRSVSFDYSFTSRLSNKSIRTTSSLSRQAFKDINKEIKTGLSEIKNDLAVRKSCSKVQLKGQIQSINAKEKSLKGISNRFSQVWLKIQKKTMFLSLLRKSLRNARTVGIDPKKLHYLNKATLLVRPKRNPSVLYPKSSLYKSHIFVLLLLILYLILFYPIDIAFNLSEQSLGLFVVDNFITAYFCLDILLSFFTAFERQGVLVDNHRDIVKNYLMKWFLFDVLAVIPFDVFFNRSNLKLKRLLKLPRLLRMLNSFTQNSESKKTTRSMISQKLKLIFSSAKAYHIASSLLFALIFIHISASFWCILLQFDDVTWLSS